MRCRVRRENSGDATRVSNATRIERGTDGFSLRAKYGIAEEFGVDREIVLDEIATFQLLDKTYFGVSTSSIESLESKHLYISTLLVTK